MPDEWSPLFEGIVERAHLAAQLGAPVASLEPALWKRLTDADNVAGVARAWQ